MLVEEEDIFDEHKSSTLRNSREEPVQYPSRHEAVKGRCSSAPDCCEERKDDEVE